MAAGRAARPARRRAGLGQGRPAHQRPADPARLAHDRPDGPWTDDAPPVARVREHGGVLVGKTTTPELGWKGVTDSPLTGVTRNPWDPARTAGRLQRRRAAAVALGMGPLSLGTDGGGSVRIPAAFSGIFAHKPTYGRVPPFPASPFGTLAHVGPMALDGSRTPRCCSTSSRASDSRDWSARPPPPRRSPRWTRPSPACGSRSARRSGTPRCDPEVAAVVRGRGRGLRRARARASRRPTRGSPTRSRPSSAVVRRRGEVHRAR